MPVSALVELFQIFQAGCVGIIIGTLFAYPLKRWRAARQRPVRHRVGF